ncbi:putative pyrroloquinoline-quinone binding quinoprotein [Algoriphagus boseongensis]|uniref:Putative pyrroloquinoline-quinone binding quinoprotein n=1 Tax=Algoriphagus boseongensis TaxID=1442587 RepID=A0A4R6T5G3_9BACT|nr:PQQ-binding-like beta-propeller repeat protein [Algoriphagus boseongensis]TDQ17583.1 putative pyrroloquinoline-quinone binding quinoprotein [Algoriphagus boseongensis]
MKKLNKTTRLLFLAFAFAIGFGTKAFSQEPQWKLSLEKGVEWTKHTPNKILLVGSSDWGLHGVDAATGKLLWSNEDLYNSAKALKGPDGKKVGYTADLIRVLEDNEDPRVSDYAIVKYTDNILVKNFVVINIRTGELVLDPRSAGMPVVKIIGPEQATFNYDGSDYLPELKSIIITASWEDLTQKGAPFMQKTKLYNIESGGLAWESDEVSSKFLPVITPDNNLLFIGEKTAAKINAKTGQPMWKFEVAEKKNNFEAFDANIHLTEGYFYQKKGNQGVVSAVSLSDGKVIWEKPLASKDAPVLTAENFGVIVADEKNFTLMEAETGNTKWTAKKLSGIVVDLGKDYGIAVGEKDKYLTVLDKNTGEEKWSQKIKGIRIDQLTGAGIMYMDEEGSVGLFGFDGKPVWDGKDMIKGPVLRAKPSLDQEIFYSDEKVYHVNLATGQKKVIINKVEFNEKETPDNLEFTGSNFVLSSSQNMMGFDANGNVLYQDHWASPKISLAGRIAMRTMQVAMVAMASAAAYQQGLTQGSAFAPSSISKQYGTQREFFEDMSGAFGQVANQRFKATKHRGVYSFILTDVGEGVGLVKVDKISGKEVGKIVLNDKEPVFDSDPENGMIFYKPSKKDVFGYTF